MKKVSITTVLYVILFISIIAVILIPEKQNNILTDLDEQIIDRNIRKHFKADSLETLINLYMKIVLEEAYAIGEVDYNSGTFTLRGEIADSIVNELYKEKYIILYGNND